MYRKGGVILTFVKKRGEKLKKKNINFICRAVFIYYKMYNFFLFFVAMLLFF